MKKSEFMQLDLYEAIDVAYNNFNVHITSEDILKEYILRTIQKDNFGLALHLLKAIYENPIPEAEMYLYDYSMGTLDTPTPITDIEDLLDWINEDEFDEEDE